MSTHMYNDGITSTSGRNTITHYYNRAGIKAANRVNVFQQFADKKTMQQKMGKTFKISKWLHMYDRAPDDPQFAKKGYMTARSMQEVGDSLNSASLPEGAGPMNKRTIKKITMETQFARYGEMIEYTDEVDIFSEDKIQALYHMELGELANSRVEDLNMRDMLSTGTRIFAGPATSKDTIGLGVDDAGILDAAYKVSYDLMRNASRKLKRNRAKKSTSVISGTSKVDTKVVAPSYFAIIGADVRADLELLTRGTGAEKQFVFTPIQHYAAAGTLADGEVGAMHEIRFIEAEGMVVYEGAGAPVPANYTGTLGYAPGPRSIVQNTTQSTVNIGGLVAGNPYGTTVQAGEFIEVEDESHVALLTAQAGIAASQGRFNVHPILFPTEGAFATVGLKGLDRIQFHSRDPKKVDGTNPYGTRGFFTYNFFYAGILLQEERMLKVLVAASS